MRLKTLESDPLTRWRVTKLQWKHWKMYDRFIDAGEQTIRTTSTAQAPWTIVEGRDEQYRSITVAESLRDAISRRLSDRAPSPRKQRQAEPPGRSAG